MIKSRSSLTLVLGFSMLASACTTSRMPGSEAIQPDPLPAAPTGRVDNRPLPPPSGPTSFPDKPQSPQVASVEPPPTSPTAPTTPPPSSGGPVNKNAMLGSWKASGADSCQVFMTLTKFGQVSRGGSRGCSGDLQKMRGWDVKGQQIVLYDDSGNQVAALYNSGGNRYDGQTSSGQSVSLSR